jgi:hypothetical protein
LVQAIEINDLDRYYSVESITGKVIEQIENVNGNKMALKHRKGGNKEYLIDVMC